MRDLTLTELRDLHNSYLYNVFEAKEDFITPPTVEQLSPSLNRIQITDGFCKKWYNLFNKWYFDNLLPQNLPIFFKQFSTDKTTLGFAYSEWKIVNGKQIIYPKKIEINAIYGFNEYQLFDTLIHEMIHILDYAQFPEHFENQNYKCHGAWFKSICSKLSKYGWNISTYDTTAAKWSPEYYNSIADRLKAQGRIPLIGFVEKENGMCFITKTDGKDYVANANGCVAQSAKSISLIKKISYYEIRGCKFATIKNQHRYWKSKFGLDNSLISKYQKAGKIGDTPFFVYTPPETTKTKSFNVQEFEHLMSNRNKMVRGVLLAMATSLYNIAVENYDSYSENPEELDLSEMAVGFSKMLGIKTLNNFTIYSKLTKGFYDDNSKAMISYDTHTPSSNINLKWGNIVNEPHLKTVVGELIDDLDSIRERADDKVPEKYWDGWKAMEYRDEVAAPKIVMDIIKDDSTMVRYANEILNYFLESYKKEVEMESGVSTITKASVGESVQDEKDIDVDLDTVEIDEQIIDKYAKHVYDKFKMDGDTAKVRKTNPDTIEVAIY